MKWFTKYYRSEIAFVLLIASLFEVIDVHSQSSTKEAYDNIFHRYFPYPTDLLTRITDIKDGTHEPLDENDIVVQDYADLLGYRYCYVWASYLTMYKTTGDKAYLHEFIKQTYFVQQFRNDKQDAANHPGWWSVDDDDPSMHLDGQIIWPMAQFCFIMKHDPDYIALADKPLPSAATLTITDQYKWPAMVTYGDFANWLAARVDETLTWFIVEGYWDNRFGFMRHPSDGEPNELNMQAPFASALFHLGAFYKNVDNTKSQDYLNKSLYLASGYKGNTMYGEMIGENCVVYTEPIFRQYTGEDAYVWHHNGWQKHLAPWEQRDHIDCLRGAKIGYWEDISHGAMDLVFPIAVYDFQQEYWGTTIFNATDMQRFAGTLSRLLYFDSDGPNFYYSVNTGDYDCYICPDNDNGAHTDEDNRKAALMWANLQQFDNPDYYQNVYNILMLYYNTTLDGQNNNAAGHITGGNHYLGLAYLAQQQWERECTDLTLYNRDVVYNQSFLAKKALLVIPESPENPYDKPMSDPKEFADGLSNERFVVESGVTVDMVAGESIVLKSGTHIKAGSTFHAGIDPNLCSGNKNLMSTTNKSISQMQESGSVVETSSLQEKVNPQSKNELSFNIYPNPAKGEVFIALSLPDQASVTIKMTDIFGRQMIPALKNEFSEAGEFYSSIDLTGVSRGLYYFTLYIDNKLVQTRKIVVFE